MGLFYSSEVHVGTISVYHVSTHLIQMYSNH